MYINKSVLNVVQLQSQPVIWKIKFLFQCLNPLLLKFKENKLDFEHQGLNVKIFGPQSVKEEYTVKSVCSWTSITWSEWKFSLVPKIWNNKQYKTICNNWKTDIIFKSWKILEVNKYGSCLMCSCYEVVLYKA